MKLRIPIAVIVLLAVAYVYFYMLGATESQGSTSLGVANAVGLVAVVVGVIAAGFILRRGGPPQSGTDGSRNP